MRIIAGSRRGLALTSVGKGDTKAALRPTPDRVRESLFSMLSARRPDPLVDARVLDLFAGTGALGLEALSRGASHVHFVEKGAASLYILGQNIEKCRFRAETKVHKSDATHLHPSADAPATLVFLDPPYGRDLGARALTSAAAAGWLAPGALVIWEEETPQTPPQGFAMEDTRTFGRTVLTLLTFARA